MWRHRRAFLLLVLSTLLTGSVFFARVHLTKRRPLPDFLLSVARFRPSVVCASYLVILVNSVPQNAQRRQVIRETWAHPVLTGSIDLGVVFGVGLADSRTQQKFLNLEAVTFGDLFQVAVPRANRTEKALAQLKQVANVCLPRFVLKVEDDVFVNSLALVELLKDLERESPSSTLWCLPSQSTNGQPSNATAHCDSPVYLMTSRALARIVYQHENRTDHVLQEEEEDAYVTGTLARDAGVVRSQLDARIVHHRHQVDRKTVFAHLGSKTVEHTHRLWQHLVKSRSELNRNVYRGL